MMEYTYLGCTGLFSSPVHNLNIGCKKTNIKYHELSSEGKFQCVNVKRNRCSRRKNTYPGWLYIVPATITK